MSQHKCVGLVIMRFTKLLRRPPRAVVHRKMFLRNASRVPVPQRTTAPLRLTRAVAGSVLITPDPANHAWTPRRPARGRNLLKKQGAKCMSSAAGRMYANAGQRSPGESSPGLCSGPPSHSRALVMFPVADPRLVPDIGTPFVDQPI